LVGDDEEAKLRKAGWQDANIQHSCAIVSYLIDKEKQKTLSHEDYRAAYDAGSEEEMKYTSFREGRERSSRARLAMLLKLRPDLRGELDALMPTWPRSGVLLRALEEQSQIRKFLNAQFDLERITLEQERAVLAAGDEALKRTMDKHGITEVQGYRGELAVEAANKTMKLKIKEICPDLSREVKKLGFSWNR
jgi:hypothetical protein